MKAGWVTTTLAESCEMYQPKTISGKDMVPDGAYPVFGANGIIGRYDKYNHEEPQLLITCRGATCGSVNVSEPFSWITGNAMVVRAKKSDIDMRFLEYLFRGGLDISKAITGAAQPQITRTNLAPLQICYPASLPEQHRIVALLDEAFAGIATAKANAEKNLQNARALFESHLQSVFTERGEGWVERKLGDQTLLSMIDGDRGANYPKATDFLDDGPCLFLNTKNVRPDGFEFDSTMFISAEKDAQLRKGKLQRNDVVMTTRGTIGNIGLYSEEVPFESVRINSGMLIFRPNPKEILPAYLFEILRSGIVREQIRKYTTGAAQPQLPIKTLVNFSIPVPTALAGQLELVKRIREFEPETQHLESLYQRKLAALDALKQSLLHQAFSGSL
jgi:type I restriction enzyme, S subunit